MCGGNPRPTVQRWFGGGNVGGGKQYLRRYRLHPIRRPLVERYRTNMPGTDIGALLRHAREQRALSITEIANRTNICPHVLEAIERNALNKIPGGLFTRGYLRAFAAEVGLDGERLVGEYVSDVGCEGDVLEQLRARFDALDHGRHTLIQLVIVIVCIACFLYVLVVREADRSASEGKPQQHQSLHRSTPSAILSAQ